jgi:hypothetical protein
VLECAEISGSDILSGTVTLLRMVGMIWGAWQLTRASSAAYRILKTDADDANTDKGTSDSPDPTFCHIVPQADLNAQTLLKGDNSVTRFGETAS